MSDPFEIKKGFFGGYTIGHDCPHCSIRLKSPIDDAGQSDTCPKCGRQFNVPGVAERNKIRKAEALVAESKRMAKSQRLHKKQLQGKRRRLPTMLADVTQGSSQPLVADAELEQWLSREASRSVQRTELAKSPLEDVREAVRTRTCPYCGEAILLVAKKCKHCGEFSKPPLEYVYEVIAAVVAIPVLLFLLFFVVPWFLSSSDPKPDLAPPKTKAEAAAKAKIKRAEAKQEELFDLMSMQVAVWNVAKRYITQRLSSPGTADFDDGFWGGKQNSMNTVKFLGNNLWRVNGYVDAQNKFGGTVRTRFQLTVKYAGTEGPDSKFIVTQATLLPR